MASSSRSWAFVKSFIVLQSVRRAIDDLYLAHNDAATSRVTGIGLSTLRGTSSR
jgi:hypothetical protein